ncbi:MAG: DNA alkylation repair protein [Bacteroidaceae bacterium]|nr:DNA alkylation repair protein [Bacteroidaceae bacterium]
MASTRHTEQVRRVTDALLALADSRQAQGMARFFKTGAGEYGEKDRFLGVTNPQTLRVVKTVWRETTPEEAAMLVRNEWHEVRLCGLLILVAHYERAARRRDVVAMAAIFRLYTSLHPFVNNWNLVDLSAYKIVGDYEMRFPKTTLMDAWITPSHTLWQQRIAMVATWKHVRHDRFCALERRAQCLLTSREPLLHKAAGWMLREMGKRSEVGLRRLEEFLEQHCAGMPSVMLSYATERMTEERRLYWRARRKG